MTSNRLDSRDLASRSEYQPLNRFSPSVLSTEMNSADEAPPSVSFLRDPSMCINARQRPTLRFHPQLRNALDLRTGKPIRVLDALLRPTPTRHFQTGTSMGLLVFRAFPSAPTTHNSSLRVALHAFFSRTLPQGGKQACSHRAHPSRGFEGVSHRRVRIHPEALLHARKDRCSPDFLPFEVFPKRLAAMLPYQLLLWASSLKLPDTLPRRDSCPFASITAL